MGILSVLKMLDFHQFCFEIIFNAYFHQNTCYLLLAFLIVLSIVCLECNVSRKWLYSIFIIKWIYIWIWIKLYVKNHIYTFIYKLHAMWTMTEHRQRKCVGFFFFSEKSCAFWKFVSDWNDSSEVFSVPLVNNDMLTKWHFCYCYWNKHRQYKRSTHWEALRSSLITIFPSTGFCEKTWWPTVKWHFFRKKKICFVLKAFNKNGNTLNHIFLSS